MNSTCGASGDGGNFFLPLLLLLDLVVLLLRWLALDDLRFADGCFCVLFRRAFCNFSRMESRNSSLSLARRLCFNCGDIGVLLLLVLSVLMVEVNERPLSSIAGGVLVVAVAIILGKRACFFLEEGVRILSGLNTHPTKILIHFYCSIYVHIPWCRFYDDIAMAAPSLTPVVQLPVSGESLKVFTQAKSIQKK